MLTIAAWSRAERSHFESAKRRWGNSTAYEQTWLYVCQALRRGGWTCRGDLGWAAVAADYSGAGKHALVVSMAADPAKFVATAIDQLCRKNICPVLVKHLSIGAARQLTASGAFSSRNETGDATESFLEEYSEDALPQIIIDLTRFSTPRSPTSSDESPQWLPQGHYAADFRYQVRRFFRACGERNMEHRDLRHTPPGSVCQLLDNWLVSVRGRYRTGHPKVSSYNRCFREPVQAVIDQLQRYPKDGFGSVILYRGDPVAHWSAAEIATSNFGIYTLIADTSIRNLAHYTLYSALVDLHNRGAASANLGGSETESLFHFKSRLMNLATPASLPVRFVYDLKVERPADHTHYRRTARG